MTFRRVIWDHGALETILGGARELDGHNFASFIFHETRVTAPSKEECQVMLSMACSYLAAGTVICALSPHGSRLKAKRRESICQACSRI